MPEFDSYAHGTPCWTDLTSPELDRSLAFYVPFFGWTAEPVPQPDAGGYVMFTLEGKYVAAAGPPQQEGMPSYWTTYLATDDLDETVARARDAGGTVLLEPLDVYDSGRMAIAQDPGGATFGVWQAREHIGAQLANEPGTMVWNECQTTDPIAAASFYQAVFGHEADAVPMVQGGPPYHVLKVGGKAVAGILELTGELQGVPPNWSTVFAVADTDAAVARAGELGGSALMPGMDLPGIGRLAVLQDPLGAVFQILQPAS